MRIPQNIQRPLLIISCLLVGGLLTACGVGNTISQVGQSQVSQAQPTITLHNPSPAQLSVFVNVSIGGYDETTRATTTLSFSFISQGKAVQFSGNEQFICNDKAISLQNNAYGHQLTGPTSTLAGQTLHCTYSAGSTSTILTLTVPHAPGIHTQHNQVHLPRSKNTIVSYDAPGGTLMGIVALSSNSASKPGKAIAQLDTPGAGQATIDTSSFSPGSGTITLTATLNVQVMQSGTPFASLNSSGQSIAELAVTWA